MATIPHKVSTRGSKKQPPAANKANLGGVKTAKTAKRGGTTDLDIFSEELEKKYNIEGSNTLDIVYARHENDAANATIAAQAAQLEALMRQLEAMKATECNNTKVTADDVIPAQPDVPMHDVEAPKAPMGTSINSKTTNAGNAALEGTEEGKDVPMADALVAENAELRCLLAAACAGAAADQGPEGPALGSIPRPAGSSFSIQDAMRLGKSAEDRAKYKGLGELTLRAGVNWEKPWADVSAEVKGKLFAVHVINGDFKDNTVFTGLIEAKILGKDREIKGLGKQNFKYNEDLDAIFGLVYTISPSTYWELSKHFNLRSEHSIKQIISKSPRFPVGITDETFGYAQRYCEEYKYPLGTPLSLAVDDSKLFPALQPLYNGVKGRWFIVGTTGEPVEVLDPEALHRTINKLEKTTEMATKLRLWILQIPLPGVPPLVLAIMPIGPKVKGPQLADWKIKLVDGLISRGFRIASGGGDGASVKRDCQRKTAAAKKLKEFRIKHGDPDYPDIVVELWDWDGNIWFVFNDSKHCRKMFRNNASSGAHLLTLGNFVVYFQQVYTLAMKPQSPLYKCDVKDHGRMDDPAAARLFSADTLAQAAEDPTENLGLVAYPLVFGDFIDTWQSRTLSHHERAKVAIRTHLFLQTWRIFLKKAGYSEARYFISKEAFDISQILINGSCPYPPPPSDFKKQASGYCHTYFSSENINYPLLSQYPTDVELWTAYQIAAEENDCLWALLGIHLERIKSAPTPGQIPQPFPDPDFVNLYIDGDQDIEPEATEQTAAEELQQVIDSLKGTANLSRAAGQELDACVMASVALSMDELARIENPPDSDPERFLEIQKDIVQAMATQPAAFISLLQGIVVLSSSEPGHLSEPIDDGTLSPPSSKPLVDVSADDLSQFVALRREHQTREAQMGVRTYKSSTMFTNHK
ncbi:hypothetical protein B0H10DRAFT_2206481 [Mycena sp. CBHHK59/15]|nr:hypothetical protein B0H10DRAFT_2206481 [Mycena sp. CBHHK59/15]